MRRQAKNQLKGVTDWLVFIAMIVGGIGIGGLFLNGTFLSTIFLEMLPQLVHTIVGWTFIGASVLTLINKFI